jgi:protein ImuB
MTRLSTDRLRRDWRAESGRAESGRAESGGATSGEPDRPLVTTLDAEGRCLIAAVSGAAAAEGLSPGMTLADARAVFPTLDARPDDPAADAALLRRLALWGTRYSPWVAVEGRDGLFFDITGCAHLFGGEHALLDDVTARLRKAGFAVRAGLADTPGAAWALAHYGESGTIALPGDVRAALAGLPPAALRLGPAAAGGLARMGLTRIDALAAVPRASLAARFGAARFGFDLSRRLDQAYGAAPEPLSPLGPVTPYRARLTFAEPIALIDDIARGLRCLLDELCARLEHDSLGCRRLDLSAHRVDGAVQTVSVGAARAVRHAARLARLFAERLGEFDPGFGIEIMILSAPVVEPLAPTQGAEIFSDPAATLTPSAMFKGEDVAPLIDRLGNRLGFEQVVRLVPFESHAPERVARHALVLDARGTADWPETPPRPLRLFRRPERIEALGPSYDRRDKDSPPGCFVWRRIEHRVCDAVGPERIAPEWWRSGASSSGASRRSRDYWRVVDEEGRRFWIYRNGLPPQSLSGPKRPPDWFLHGLFA